MKSISTEQAPAAIGTYSQAILHNGLVYISGQIPLCPSSMEVVSDDFTLQAEQVFKNLAAVCDAAGGGLQDILKLTIYLIDLNNFQAVNTVMEKQFTAPYPARAVIEVSGLPRGVAIEVEALLALPS